MAAEDEGVAQLAEEKAALAEEGEEPLLRRLGARRAVGPTYLEELASKWEEEEDDVPIAHLRRREVGGPSGVPEEPRDRPGGPSLEPVEGRPSPEREVARPGGGDGGGAPPTTPTGVQEPLVVEEEPLRREEEPLGVRQRCPSRGLGRRAGIQPTSFMEASWLTGTCTTPP